MFDTGFIDRSLFSALPEAETILSSQFFERVKVEPSTQPEKRLMLAVMEEAIGTFQKCLTGTTPRQRRLLREVEEWFASDDVTWLFSFQNICVALDLDADYLRLGLREWKARQLDKRNPSPSTRQGHSRRHIRIAANASSPDRQSQPSNTLAGALFAGLWPAVCENPMGERA
jgi:hypothetical protein